MLPTYILLKANEAEESDSKQHVKCVSVNDVLQYANVISSHTVYKVNHDDDGSLRIKARIAPHGNEDSLKHIVKSDCAMSSPTSIRYILTIAALNRCVISRADVKFAFLETGQAQRDVFVRTPRESADKRHYWLLLSAAYVLVNANAKI